MTETHVDNTVSYTQKAGWKMLAFTFVFIIAGGISIVKFDSYFTDFWKIRNCQADGYERQEYTTTAMDEYFKKKGLTYYLLAAEGSGYKSAILALERLNLKPKIIMVNHEIFQTNKISPVFRELVDFPEKYKTRFTFFYNAQKVHKWSCKSKFDWIREFYCSGTARGKKWRSAVTGAEKWSFVADDKDQVLINPNPDSRISIAGELVNRSRELLESKDFGPACPIWYIVNNPTAGTNSLAIAGEELGIQTAFVEVSNLYTYDNSHLDRPNSEKWAKEFVKVLDPVIDTCLSGKAQYVPKVKETYEAKEADVTGVTDFESWSIRTGVTVSNATAAAPDDTITADTILVEKAGTPLQKVYRDTPIKAGAKMTFGGWFWSEEEMDIQLRIIKSCSRDTPMESTAKTYALSSEPTRLSVSHDFKEDHDCALIRLMGLKSGASFNAWQSRADFTEPNLPPETLDSTAPEE